MWTNGDSGQTWRAASSRLSVPTAFMSKSSNGMARGQVVAGLGGGVDDHVGLEFLHQLEHAVAVADVELVVDESVQARLQAPLVPARVALRAEENARWLLSTPWTCQPSAQNTCKPLTRSTPRSQSPGAFWTSTPHLHKHANGRQPDRAAVCSCTDYFTVEGAASPAGPLKGLSLRSVLGPGPVTKQTQIPVPINTRRRATGLLSFTRLANRNFFDRENVK